MAQVTYRGVKYDSLIDGTGQEDEYGSEYTDSEEGYHQISSTQLLPDPVPDTLEVNPNNNDYIPVSMCGDTALMGDMPCNYDCNRYPFHDHTWDYKGYPVRNTQWIEFRKVTDNSNNTNLYIPDCDRGERYFNLNKVIKEEQEINNRLINLNKTL